MSTTELDKKLLERFTFEPVAYANTQYKGFKISLGNESIGSGQIVDGGYLVNNRRKPVPTLHQAVKQMIDSKHEAARKLADDSRRLMQELREAIGPIPSKS